MPYLLLDITEDVRREMLHELVVKLLIGVPHATSNLLRRGCSGSRRSFSKGIIVRVTLGLICQDGLMGVRKSEHILASFCTQEAKKSR